MTPRRILWIAGAVALAAAAARPAEVRGRVLGGPVRRLESVAAGRYVLAVEGGSRLEVEIREGGTAVLALP